MGWFEGKWRLTARSQGSEVFWETECTSVDHYVGSTTLRIILKTTALWTLNE